MTNKKFQRELRTSHLREYRRNLRLWKQKQKAFEETSSEEVAYYLLLHAGMYARYSGGMPKFLGTLEGDEKKCLLERASDWIGCADQGLLEAKKVAEAYRCGDEDEGGLDQWVFFRDEIDTIEKVVEVLEKGGLCHEMILYFSRGLDVVFGDYKQEVQEASQTISYLMDQIVYRCPLSCDWWGQRVCGTKGKRLIETLLREN